MSTPLLRPDLGWHEFAAEDPQVVDLRERLAGSSGIRGLEVCSPDEVERAVRIFNRDGFVVIRDALTAAQLDATQHACIREVETILAIDGTRGGNRGSHRYSFGGSSKTNHMSHVPEWAMLIDVATVTPVIAGIFDSMEYFCRGGGGDFCLPGTMRYQHLHSDINDRRKMPNRNGSGEVTSGSFHDPSGQLSLRDLPCMYVCANFLMNDFTSVNGPTRQIPGTQNSRQRIPRLDDEPEWMKLSTVCPAPAGSVLLRDPRAWHGGTPNLSDEVRAIPNAEFYAPWFYEPTPVSMPREIYDSLSDHAREICRYIVAGRGEDLDVGYRDNLGGTPERLKTPEGPRGVGT